MIIVVTGVFYQEKTSIVDVIALTQATKALVEYMNDIDIKNSSKKCKKNIKMTPPGTQNKFAT
ncbi:MAG: hypothetical protein PVJ39_13075 [Gammaproteobacteria bacterium]